MGEILFRAGRTRGERRHTDSGSAIGASQRQGQHDQGRFLGDELGSTGAGDLAAELAPEAPVVRRLVGRGVDQIPGRPVHQMELHAERPPQKTRGLLDARSPMVVRGSLVVGSEHRFRNGHSP